jgi:hypothetical protein
MSALRHGPIEHDYPMLHTRILSLRIGGESVRIYDYWKYVKGSIPGLNTEATGETLADDFQWAHDNMKDNYRFVPDGVFIDLQEPRPEIDFKPFLIKAES